MNGPCAVTLDLSRYMAQAEAEERAQEATQSRRLDRQNEILSSPLLLAEAFEYLSNQDKVFVALTRAYVGSDLSVLSAVCVEAAEAMAEADIKPVTPAQLRRERDEYRAEQRRDDLMERRANALVEC